MSRLTRDGTTEPVSRDQILRREQGQGNNHFPASADHEQDWKPYPVDPSLAIYQVCVTIHGLSVASEMIKIHLDRPGGKGQPVRLPSRMDGWRIDTWL